MAKQTRNRRKQIRKENGSKLKKMPPPAKSVDELLEIASSCVTSLDIEQAYNAYSQAARLLQQDKTISRPGSEMELINVLEKMGEIQVSMEDQDRAKEHFMQALHLLEGKGGEVTSEQVESTESIKDLNYYETHASLCLYIGQLSIEHEALDAYLRGVASLERCIQLVERETVESAQTINDDPMKYNGNTKTDPGHDQEILQEMKQRLSAAHCTLAELCLTDLCEEESAERDCEHYLEKALSIKDVDGEPLVDALQTMASLRLSQMERRLEAVSFILRAYEKQRIGSEALAALVGIREDEEKEDTIMNDGDHKKEPQAKELLEVEAANNLPEFEFRCQTAKLLLECAELLKEKRQESAGDSQAIGHCDLPSSDEEKCITAAISVLGSLLAQNDEVVEIWFLTGCAFAAKNPPMVDEARYYLDHALEMLMDIGKALEQEKEFANESEISILDDQLKMNSAQMEEVQSKIDGLQTEGHIADTTMKS